MNEFGDLLRQSRDFKGVTLREAERATRISRTYLAALEAGDFVQLPAAAYARGIVRNYAQYLGLDPVSTLTLFEQSSGGTPASVAVLPATRPFSASSHWAPNFAIIAFMLVMSAVVFAWMYSAYFQRPDALATTTIGMPTVTAVPDSILALADDQATVATQGGGVATTTPTPTMPPATATIPAQAVVVEAAPTEVVEEPVVEEPTSEVVLEDNPIDDESSDVESAEPVGTGANTFVIYTSEDVWVQVVLDGETAFDDVLPAGSERIYYADAAAITSGNASFVEVYVNGDPYGALGDTWDATFYYP